MAAHQYSGNRWSLFWRAVVGLFGVALTIFGVLGLAGSTSMWSREGQVVAGLAVNGALGILSIIVGVVIIIAAIIADHRAWTLITVIGGLFTASALVHLLVLNSGLNLLAFQFANVIFSFLAGLALMTIGVFQREGGGRIPRESAEPAREAETARQHRLSEIGPLADAEHAMAEGSATQEQERMVRRDARARAAEQRRAAYLRDPQRRIKQYRREQAELPEQRNGSRGRRLPPISTN